MVYGHVSLWHVPLVSQDHVWVGFLGLLVLSLDFDLESGILRFHVMSRTASTTVAGELVSPKNITVGSYSPSFVVNATFH